MKAQVLTVAFLALSSVSNAAIYGVDNRQDIASVPTLKTEAAAIAITVPTHYLKDFGQDFFKVDDVETFSQSSLMCSDERFAGQPVLQIGTCTGFLVGDKYLLTAGHCILPNGIVNDQKHAFCDAFSWYFSFNNADKNQTTNQVVRKNQIYKCKRIIRAENVVGGNDFAVLELERSVGFDNSSSLVSPLLLRTSDVTLNEQVFAIGHPFGLPAKFSGASLVHSISSANYFEVNLDSAGGNSGSPVLDRSKKVVGILIEGHPIDTYSDRKLNCSRVNRCNDLGTKCIANSTFPNLSPFNRIQRLKPALKYLPTNTTP